MLYVQAKEIAAMSLDEDPPAQPLDPAARPAADEADRDTLNQPAPASPAARPGREAAERPAPQQAPRPAGPGRYELHVSPDGGRPDTPGGHARHYAGWTRGLDARLDAHRQARGTGHDGPGPGWRLSRDADSPDGPEAGG
jgi:hypothetical protein